MTNDNPTWSSGGYTGTVSVNLGNLSSPTSEPAPAGPEAVVDKALGGLGSGVGRFGTGRMLWGTPAVPLPKPFEEMGAPGTAVWGGYVQVKDESPQWAGRQRWRTASELMVNTSVVAAGIHYFLNLIAKSKWTAKAAQPGNPVAEELASWTTHVLRDMETPWPKVVRQAGMFRFHGFSTMEWIAKRRTDGSIGLLAIEPRPQHTIEQWAVDDKGTVVGLFQRSPQTNELLGIPRGKLLYLVEDTMTDSPEGLGVLRHLGEPYQRLKRFMALEARAYERDLRGIPVGHAPLSAINAAVKNGQLTEVEAKQLVAGMQALLMLQVKQSDTGLLLDSQPYISTTQGGPVVSDVKQWQFELLSGPALGLTEIAAAIERIQREMARIIGVEHLMLGGDSSGNRSLAQDKSKNIYLIASSVLETIVSTVQRDIINPLWELNCFPEELKPTLVAEDIAPRDVVEIATTLARIAQAGAVLDPMDPAVNDMRDLLGISRVQPIIDPMDPALAAPTDDLGNPIPADPTQTQAKPLQVQPRMLLSREHRQQHFRPELQRLPREGGMSSLDKRGGKKKFHIVPAHSKMNGTHKLLNGRGH